MAGLLEHRLIDKYNFIKLNSMCIIHTNCLDVSDWRRSSGLYSQLVRPDNCLSSLVSFLLLTVWPLSFWSSIYLLLCAQICTLHEFTRFIAAAHETCFIFCLQYAISVWIMSLCLLFLAFQLGKRRLLRSSHAPLLDLFAPLFSARHSSTT